MKDPFGRTIDYLRIAITDRCNLRCTYCMPPQGVQPLHHDQILRYEEILRIAQSAIDLGIRRFRISGGEPLVRRGLTRFLAELTRLEGCEQVALTTNGLLLGDAAHQLAAAGVSTVNVSLDTLDSLRMGTLCGGGPPSRIVEGIDAAIASGLSVKINTVLLGTVLNEVPDLVDLAERRRIPLRFIEYMPIIGDATASEITNPTPVSVDALMRRLSQLGPIEASHEIRGSGPATYVRIRGRSAIIGIISAVSTPFCHRCNRLRLTPDGRLKPCLASPTELDILSLLRNGASDEELTSLLRSTAAAKPAQHEFHHGEVPGRFMNRIGG